MLGFFAFQREATLHRMQGQSEKLPCVCQTTKLQMDSKGIQRFDTYICPHLLCFASRCSLVLWLPKSQGSFFPAVNTNEMVSLLFIIKDSGILSSLELHWHIATKCGLFAARYQGSNTHQQENEKSSQQHFPCPVEFTGGFYQKLIQPIG